MKPVIRVLNDMVRDGVVQGYAVGGATALLYFSKPTFTEDIDVFIRIERSASALVDLSSVYAYLAEKKGAVVRGEHVLIEGYPVQFLVPYDDLSEEAFQKAVPVSLGGSRFRVFDLEYLMAIMVQLGKENYRERLRILFQSRTFQEKKLQRILKRFHLIQRWNKLKKGLKG